MKDCMVRDWCNCVELVLLVAGSLCILSSSPALWVAALCCVGLSLCLSFVRA